MNIHHIELKHYPLPTLSVQPLWSLVQPILWLMFLPLTLPFYMMQAVLMWPLILLQTVLTWPFVLLQGILSPIIQLNTSHTMRMSFDDVLLPYTNQAMEIPQHSFGRNFGFPNQQATVRSFSLPKLERITPVK
jgi:hypothetical protein